MATENKNSISITIMSVKTDTGTLEQVGADLEYEDTDAFEGFFMQEINDSEGPVLLGIEGWGYWTDAMLRKVMPNLPPPTYHQMGFPKPGATSLPTMNLGGSETSFVVNFIEMVELKQLDRDERKTPNPDKSRTAKPFRVFCWTCEAGGINARPNRPIIVVCVEPRDSEPGSNNDLERILERHLLFNRRRWDRFGRSLHWIAIDLFFIYNRWDETLEVITDTVANTEIAVYMRSLPTMILARSIHHDIGTLIELSEYIHLQGAVTQQIRDAVGRTSNQKGKGKEGTQSLLHLEKRLSEIALHLQHVKSTSEIMQKQLENLLSLAFNTETIEQGRTVARLTGLAFVFVPLSFLASLFGMTTSDWQTVWYAPAAVASLIITVLAAILSHRAVDLWDNYQYGANHSKLTGLLRANTLDLHEEAIQFSMRKPTRKAILRLVKQKPKYRNNGRPEQDEQHPSRKGPGGAEGSSAAPAQASKVIREGPRLPPTEIVNIEETRQESRVHASHGGQTNVGVPTNDVRSEIVQIDEEDEENADFVNTSPSAYRFHMRRTAAIQSTIERKLQSIPGFSYSRYDRTLEALMTPSNYGIRLNTSRHHIAESH